LESMSEDEKQKPGGFKFNREEFESNRWDAFKYGMGLGASPDFLESLRRAHEAGIIGVKPIPITDIWPLPPGTEVPPVQKKPQDAADAKIAELEGRLRREILGHEQALGQLQMSRMEVHQLRMEKGEIEDRLYREMGRVREIAPVFIKKYLKFLIFACHPDRNPGRDEALEVTKALLDLRGKK